MALEQDRKKFGDAYAGMSEEEEKRASAAGHVKDLRALVKNKHVQAAAAAAARPSTTA